MRKTILLIYLSIFILSQSCNKTDDNLPTFEEQLAEMGNTLANWGNKHCKIIYLNEKYILWQGPNAGGCSSVYFEYIIDDEQRVVFFDYKALEKRHKELGIDDSYTQKEIFRRNHILNTENTVKENFRMAIDSSDCIVSELASKINSINRDTTEEEVIKKLDCLGNVKIVEGHFETE